jgi:hypothetical protein
MANFKEKNLSCANPKSSENLAQFVKKIWRHRISVVLFEAPVRTVYSFWARFSRNSGTCVCNRVFLLNQLEDSNTSCKQNNWNSMESFFWVNCARFSEDLKLKQIHIFHHFDLQSYFFPPSASEGCSKFSTHICFQAMKLFLEIWRNLEPKSDW